MSSFTLINWVIAIVPLFYSHSNAVFILISRLLIYIVQYCVNGRIILNLIRKYFYELIVRVSIRVHCL
jgi:hypothetical protein